MAAKIFRLDTRGFSKSANLSMRLASAPEDWDQEIMAVLLKQSPWLSEYVLSLDFVKKIPDRQYGVGGVVVYPRVPQGAPSTKPSGEQEDPMGNPVAHIPVIIREGELQPLDVFISETDVLPLEEQLFKRRANALAAGVRPTTGTQIDPTIIGYLWPPGRIAFGGQNTELGMTLMSKISSSGHTENQIFFKLLQKLADDEIKSMEDGERFEYLEGLLDGTYCSSHKRAEAVKSAVASSMFLRPVVGDIVDGVVESLPKVSIPRGDVTQVIKTAGGYDVRTADTQGFSFDRRVPAEISVGDNGVSRVYVNFDSKAVVGAAEKIAAVDDVHFGLATIYDGTARRRGVLFPHVVDFNGNSTGEQFFASVDEPLHGSGNFKVATLGDCDVPSAPLAPGKGVFAFKYANDIACSVPVTISRKSEGMHGSLYFATVHNTDLANTGFPVDTRVKIAFSAAVAKPLYVAKTAELVLPSDYQWVPVGGDKAFSPFEPLVASRNVVKMATLGSDEYLFDGAPLNGVVEGPRSAVDAQFVLASLGVPVEKIDEVMASGGAVTLVDCNVLKMRPAAMQNPDIDADLLKAAAELDDPNTVDAVLGLNMADFAVEDDYQSIASILEDAQQRVARLLLLSRLGFSVIPDGAAKVVMLRLTPLIDALKIQALQHAYRQ